ncbi:MAG: hypothetical protein M3065_18475 [Actinomycetota bacterium]|nr:hypothetical protein [Actinomycetota bacterium]
MCPFIAPEDIPDMLPPTISSPDVMCLDFACAALIINIFSGLPTWSTKTYVGVVTV